MLSFHGLRGDVVNESHTNTHTGRLWFQVQPYTANNRFLISPSLTS
jgi:hypothetical protein